MTAAKAAGYTFATLANRIVEVAHKRHGAPNARADQAADSPGGGLDADNNRFGNTRHGGLTLPTCCPHAFRL